MYMYNKMTERIQGNLLVCGCLGETSLWTPVQVTFYLEYTGTCHLTVGKHLELDDSILVWMVGCTFSHEPQWCSTTSHTGVMHMLWCLKVIGCFQLRYNLLRLLSYMWSIANKNVIMQHMTIYYLFTNIPFQSWFCHLTAKSGTTYGLWASVSFSKWW